MEAVFTSKAKEKSHRTHEADASPETDLSSPRGTGATAGLPLFLRGAGIATGGGGFIQRQPEPGIEEEELEEEELPVQTKLIIGQPADAYEQEADQIAETAAHQSVLSNSKPAAVPMEARDDRIQRANASVPQPSAGSPLQTPDSGSPLSGRVREKVEPLLGADLGHVRVHTGAPANDAAQGLRAKAFTYKNHIWLGPHQNPNDVGLMAHEASHVIQQSSAPTGPQLIQRKPADYQHPEDGGAVLSRMQARIREGAGDSGIEIAAAPGGASHGTEPAVAPPVGEAAGENPEAARASAMVDREELEAKKGELQPEANPDVDRPAEERPRVEQSAGVTEEVVDTPGEPLVEGEQAEAATEKEGEGKEKEEGKGDAMSEAEQAAVKADQAFAAASAQVMPSPESPVSPPEPVSPVDAAGMPLPDDPETEFEIAGLAERAQTLRDEGLHLRMLATQERGNAEVLRGNIEMVRGGLSQAEEGVAKSNDHLAFRQQLVGQARESLTISEQKAQLVAEQAPDFSTKADEGKEETGPMANEAGELAGESAANTPDDPEAAANAQEQGGKINQAGSDINTTDDAITQTQTKAQSLGEDAARAQEMNAQTQEKITAMDETLSQTSKSLSRMVGQNREARGQVVSMESQPDQLLRQAASLDEQGAALIQASYEIETQLRQAQTGFERGMKSVPGSKALEDPDEQPAPKREDQTIQLLQEDGGTPADQPPTALPELSEAMDAGMSIPLEAAVPETTSPQELTSQSAAQSPSGEGRYGERVDLDLASGLPSWLTGVDPVSEHARMKAQQAEQERRRSQIAQINQMANGRFENLSASQKMGIALQLTGQNLFGSVSNIRWPGWGHLALGLIDPRGPLMGVAGGLSMTLSGAANLFSSEQWERDPLGNLLKSAADIATGLTIILGSITALAGVIIAIMTAITILSLGTAAPVTGPIIAFCATVLTTVGGWTIAVGKVALILQALVFIKNLIDAATARTAEDLQNQSDQMTQNVSNAGNVVMQLGMAKLSQIGGRQMQSAISEAGGGVRFAALMGARGPLGSAVSGIRRAGWGGYAREVAGGIRGGLGRGGRYLRTTSVTQGARDLSKSARSVWRHLTTAEGPRLTGRQGLSREFLLGRNIPRGSFLSASRGIVREELAQAGITGARSIGAGVATGQRSVWNLQGEPIPDANLPVNLRERGGVDRVFVEPGPGGGRGNVVVVRRGELAEWAETNRALQEQIGRGYLTESPQGGLLSLEELRGQRVLDLAAGTRGQTVADLRARGIEAYGMDIALSDEALSRFLRRSDIATQVPFTGQFDVAFELYGGLSYGLGPDAAAALRNATGAVRPGGTLYIGPLSTGVQRELEPLVASIVQRGGALNRRPYSVDQIWRITLPPAQPRGFLDLLLAGLIRPAGSPRQPERLDTQVRSR
ncbi:MAG: DUF4157 domain-containing protein [Verrucomicrobia subdivision 3 bacterium]|nr:DUF4157 domain-containing protein [Limisphaerales bacterium]